MMHGDVVPSDDLMSVPSCDVLVVGAGPAGAAAALAARRCGADVVLLERHTMPRPKICGCCVSPGAAALLEHLGVDPRVLGTPLEAARVSAWGRSVCLPLGADLAIERACLDAALAVAARAEGARICHPATLRSVRGQRTLIATVEDAGGCHEIRTKLVIAADGLAGATLPGRRTRPGRWLGAGASLADAPRAFAPGTVWMAVGPEGYVGAVRLRDGRLNVAASLRREHAGDLGGAVNALWTRAGLPRLEPAAWRGTPTLRTRRRRFWAHRMIAAGDASGFWEPFTGEGIGWALEAGLRAGREAAELADAWSPDRAGAWSRRQRRWLARRQRGSRAVGAIVGSPWLACPALAALRRQPALADWFLAGRRAVEAGLA